MIDTKDIREGLPSASGMERFVNCAGSHQAEVGMPPLPEQKVTASGTDIHDALKTGDSENLEEDDAAVAKRLAGMETKALEDWTLACLPAHVTRPARVAEERLWIRDRKTLDLVASAQAARRRPHGQPGLEGTDTASGRHCQCIRGLRRTQRLRRWRASARLRNPARTRRTCGRADTCRRRCRRRR